MFWLKLMKAFMRKCGALSVWLASCAFGSGEGPWFAFLLVWCLALSVRAVLLPRNPADLLRAANRSPLGLPSGRKVLDRTSTNRGSLSAAFSQWLVEVAGFLLGTAAGVQAPGS